jgi:hypothetical protein
MISIGPKNVITESAKAKDDGTKDDGTKEEGAKGEGDEEGAEDEGVKAGEGAKPSGDAKKVCNATVF